MCVCAYEYMSVHTAKLKSTTILSDCWRLVVDAEIQQLKLTCNVIFTGIDFLYLYSIKFKFVNGTVHLFATSVRNLCDVTAVFNKLTVNQNLVIQDLFAFSFLYNKAFG